MRAFFSIQVPPATAEGLLKLVPPMRGVRRARAEGVHLTLHFLADAPATLASDLGGLALPKPFDLTPGRLVPLPESGPIRVVAASIAGGTEQVVSLHRAIAEELLRLGLPTERRPFVPHITLARCDPPLPQQLRAAKPMSPREDLTFPVSRLDLIESRPGGAGAGFEYHTLRSWTL